MYASHVNWELLEILLQIGRVLGARLHLSTLGLYSIGPFATIIDNDEGTLPIWFHLSFLESSSKDKVSLTESPWFDKFFPLTEGSVMVLEHYYGRSFSLLLELVQILSKLVGVICAQRFEPKFEGNQCLCSKWGGHITFPL